MGLILHPLSPLHPLNLLHSLHPDLGPKVIARLGLEAAVLLQHCAARGGLGLASTGTLLASVADSFGINSGLYILCIIVLCRLEQSYRTMSAGLF